VVKFIGDTSPTNIVGCRFDTWAPDKYMGPRGRPGPDAWEYKSFIFLLLPILAASPDGVPPEHAEYTAT
jgi:hypothetical protein